jgi:hypothetical protein
VEAAGFYLQLMCSRWIRGGRKCLPENEREHVMAGHMSLPPPAHQHPPPRLTQCVRYFVAVHSGFKEMRQGVTFVIDTTDDNMMSRQGEPAPLHSS